MLINLYLQIAREPLHQKVTKPGPAAMVPSPGTNEHPIGRTELLVTPIESP